MKSYTEFKTNIMDPESIDGKIAFAVYHICFLVELLQKNNQKLDEIITLLKKVDEFEIKGELK